MKKVWEGLFGVRDLTQNIMWDSGKCKFIDRIQDFTSTQEVGFIPKRWRGCSTGKKVAFRNIERQKLRTWDCREKRSGRAGSGSPIPDSAWTCFDLLSNCFRTCIKISLEDLYVETGALTDCLKETFPSPRVAAPPPPADKVKPERGRVRLHVGYTNIYRAKFTTTNVLLEAWKWITAKIPKTISHCILCA